MKLIDGSSNHVFSRILNVMNRIQDEDYESELIGSETRLLSADISCLIKEDKKEVGFLYLVTEYTKGLYFLDIALLKGYRNKGIGTAALKELLDTYQYKDFILGEVKEDNIACLKMINKLNAVQISPTHYLLQPERLEEFKTFIVKNNIDLTVPDVDSHDACEMFLQLGTPLTKKK